MNWFAWLLVAVLVGYVLWVMFEGMVIGFYFFLRVVFAVRRALGNRHG
jgi:hypothetical protein